MKYDAVTRALGAVFALTLVGGLSSAAPANAESVTVKNSPSRDITDGEYIAIVSARFANSAKGLKVRVKHFDLQPQRVDEFRVTILADLDRSSFDRRSYRVERLGLRRATLTRQSPGQEMPDRIVCPGLSMRILASSREVRGGEVVVFVPHACLRGSNSVRVGYEVFDADNLASDQLPSNRVGLTRWLRRG